jgi:hypothetical protein
MLVLFETPAGFALFKVLDEGKLDKVEDLWKEFTTSDSARRVCDSVNHESANEIWFYEIPLQDLAHYHILRVPF